MRRFTSFVTKTAASFSLSRRSSAVARMRLSMAWPSVVISFGSCRSVMTTRMMPFSGPMETPSRRLPMARNSSR